MIKVYVAKPKSKFNEIYYLDSFFLKGEQSFKHSSENIFIYQNPNSWNWVVLARVNKDSYKYERICIGFGKKFDMFMSHLSLKNIVYFNNKETIRKLVNGKRINYGKDFSISESELFK